MGSEMCIRDRRYLKSFGAFSSELSREEVVLDEYHYRYAVEMIARAKGIIDRLDSYK